MKITKLTIENFMKVNAVEIEPQGNTVIISGANAAGKSSVLNSIWAAMAGKDGMKQIAKPIRDGEDSARISVDLGEFVVTRTWTNDKTKLVIENADGAIFRSPQGMLDKLIGKLSFDAAAFAAMSDKEQAKVLLDLIDLPIDLDQLDEDRLEAYGTRTRLNKNVKHLEGRYYATVHPGLDVPDEEKSTASIMAESQKASGVLMSNQSKRQELTTYLNSQNVAQARIEALREDLRIREEALITLDQTVIELSAQVDELVDPDLEIFKCQIEDAEELNRQVRAKLERNQLGEDLKIEKARSAAKTAEIQAIDQQKADAIGSANMPVPGLGFDENGVTFNDIPFAQCSAAEQHKTSLGIGMALNPNLRVITIHDASLLDSSYMAIVQEMAKEEDYQVWLEVVDESGKMGVFIEEGEVVKDNYKASE